MKQTSNATSSNSLKKFCCTREEAAQALSISVESLDRLVSRGLINPCRALRRPLFPLEELQRFIRETSSIQ